MYDTLYRYLIFNKQVSLPGVGTISLQRNAARHSIADKIFTAPEYSFVIDNSNDRPSRKLFDWLSLAMGVSEWDAVRMVNDFSFDLKPLPAKFGTGLDSNQFHHAVRPFADVQLLLDV